ncbi:uncharacterized protein LOC119306067 isoform X2 [Triticum dicoccoides]|uniref:uncharacterized protein LOC119306067 isoform X2 n=1 Tax=Triticum dicoccoides TaxID=85692 RepID=UPI00188F51E5|nr:uncharacterized protein LOC119306067 isoform X2 [Triticum dicoccoides]
MATHSPVEVNPSNVVAISVENLKKALDKKDPFDRLTNRDKAFIDCAKIFTVVCAGGINMLNVFATTMSYNHTIKEFKRMRPVMQQVFLALTIAMLPYTLCVAGFSHAVVYKTAWINWLALLTVLLLFFYFWLFRRPDLKHCGPKEVVADAEGGQ